MRSHAMNRTVLAYPGHIPDPIIVIYASMAIGLGGLVILWLIARRNRK